jgi:hypothetical protein
VAAHNPFAWYREARSPEEILALGPRNRWICHPYTRWMNASPAVDQAAAVLVTSRETALEWGIPEHRLVAPVAAAGAREIPDPFQRAQFYRSMAMEATLDGVLARAGVSATDLHALELYSCFPCVPKMAAVHLGIDPTAELSVAGGLSFFGGPANNYMMHAIASMVERLRSGPGLGLLYGQGEFVTKHHALVVRSGPSAGSYVPGTEPLTVDGASATLVNDAPSGEGEIETFTATWNKDGLPGAGIVVGRLASGRRFIGRTRDGDTRGFRILTDGQVEPVGLPVRVEPHPDSNIVTVTKE